MTELKKIGRYIVRSRLGEGAMGSVFKAKDPFIERDVAIKIVKLDASQSEKDKKEFFDRFVQEAKISGHLNHPNIVGIYDVGEQDGMPYIAMEFVQGKTLMEYVNQDPKPATVELINVLSQLARALDFAHGKGIVHRDLKPANIMVMADCIPKIMDFGIAKMSGSNLTQTGVFLGTPSYSSPEQIKEGHVDHRSDIFSFGILASETLTGNLPFAGQSINAILYKIANEPPSFPAMKNLPMDVAGFKMIMAKVLDKDPAKRYQKASEFADALLQCLKISAQEKMLVGSQARQLDATVRDAVGVRKNLERSEFEKALASNSGIVAGKPRRKRRLWPVLLGLLLLLGAGGFYLHSSGQLGPLMKDLGIPNEWYTAQAETLEEVVEVPPDPIVMALTVNSEPSGADVYMGEAKVGQTPYRYDWDGASKSLALRLVLAGYQETVHQFVYAPDMVTEAVLTLKPLAVSESIDCDPAGATIMIDSKSIGKTPMKFGFELGRTYIITASKSGYITDSRSYTQGKSAKSLLRFKLKRVPPPGTLVVDTPIDGLQLYVDGVRQKGLQPKITEGKRTVKMIAPKYFYEESREVVMVAGQKKTIATPSLVTLKKIDYIGGFVKVKIDGRFVEHNGEHDTTPMIDLRIAAGTHEFEFIDQDGKIVTRKTIRVDKSEEIIVDSND